MKTISLPDGAKIGRNGAVTWIVGGKKKTGKLSRAGIRVAIRGISQVLFTLTTTRFPAPVGTVQI